MSYPRTKDELKEWREEWDRYYDRIERLSMSTFYLMPLCKVLCLTAGIINIVYFGFLK